MSNRKASRFPSEIAHRIAMRALPLRHLPHDRFELVLNALDLALDLLTLGRRKLFEHLWLQHFAAAFWCQGKTRRRAQQRYLLSLGELLQCSKRLFAALLELLVDHFATSAIVVALESRWQGCGQLLHQLLHRHRESRASPRRQLQAMGLLRIGEIIDVAPIRGCRLGRRLASQQVFDQIMPAATARAERIDVVTLAPHAHSKLQRFDRPFLSNWPRRFLELATHSERQFGWIAAAI